MVGFAEASLSDRTLMTYQTSGKIEYWDTASGTSIQQVETVSDLVNVRVSDDRRYLVGRSGEEIVCIDAVSGGPRYRIPAPGLLSVDVSGDADRVTWVTAEGTLQIWSASDNSFVSRPVAAQLGWRPRIVRITQDTALLAGDNGHMAVISSAGKLTEFAQDILAKASGFAARSGMLALAAEDVIHVFLLGGKAPGNSPLSELLSLPTPYPGPVGLAFLDQQRLLVWRQGDEPGALGVIDLAAHTVADLGVAFRAPLAAVTAQDGMVYTLDRGGAHTGRGHRCGQTGLRRQLAWRGVHRSR